MGLVGRATALAMEYARASKIANLIKLVETEQHIMNEEINNWHSMVDQNVSIIEKMKQSAIEEYFVKAPLLIESEK